MTDGFSVSVDNEQGPPMGWGQQYSAMAYQVVNETGTQSLRVAMPVDGIDVKTWIEQVGDALNWSRYPTTAKRR